MPMDDAPRLLLAQAKEMYARRDFAPARTALEKVLEAHPNFADVHLMLGVIYHDCGLFSRAQQSFEAALVCNPRYTEAALNLAVLYNDMGRYDDARKTYGRAMARSHAQADDIDPFVAGKIANMHAEVAEAYGHAGRLTLSVEEYGKALALRPTFADLRTRLARALMEARQYAVAAQELERAVHDRPDYLPARIQLGVCCLCMGRRDEARGHWNAVRQIEPANARAAMYLRMVEASYPLDRGTASHA